MLKRNTYKRLFAPRRIVPERFPICMLESLQRLSRLFQPHENSSLLETHFAPLKKKIPEMIHQRLPFASPTFVFFLFFFLFSSSSFKANGFLFEEEDSSSSSSSSSKAGR